MKKFLCECGKLATWDYMPSSKHYGYYCDECVPRGCGCNQEYTVKSAQAHENGYGEDPPTDHNQWKWIEKDVCWARTDAQGRELPCVEFWENLDGYEVHNDEVEYFDKHNINYRTTIV